MRRLSVIGSIVGAIVGLAVVGTLIYHSIRVSERARIEAQMATIDAVSSTALKATEINKSLRELLVRTETLQPESRLEKRKNEFLNIPAVSFIYVDKSTILDSYNDAFKEAIIEKVVETVSAEQSGTAKSGSVTGTLVKADVAGKTASELVRTARLNETSLAEKFLRFQRKIVTEGKVQLGFDEIDLRLVTADELEKDLTKLSKEYGISFPPNFIESKKAEVKNHLAESALADLEKVDGFVLLSGNYTVEPFKPAGYKLVYDHPINDYLPKTTGRKVQITCTVDSSRLELEYAVEMQQMAVGKNLYRYTFSAEYCNL
jgi:hypothetical protein